MKFFISAMFLFAALCARAQSVGLPNADRLTPPSDDASHKPGSAVLSALTAATVSPTLKVVRVVSPTTKSVVLAWDGVPGASAYRVYWGTSPGSYPNSVPVGLTQGAVVANLNVGSVYYFAATAYSATGVESEKSNEVEYRIPATVLYGVSVQLLAANSSGGPYTNWFSFPEVVITNNEPVKFFSTKLSIYPK